MELHGHKLSGNIYFLVLHMYSVVDLTQKRMFSDKVNEYAYRWCTLQVKYTYHFPKPNTIASPFQQAMVSLTMNYGYAVAKDIIV